MTTSKIVALWELFASLLAIALVVFVVPQMPVLLKIVLILVSIAASFWAGRIYNHKFPDENADDEADEVTGYPV